MFDLSSGEADGSSTACPRSFQLNAIVDRVGIECKACSRFIVSQLLAAAFLLHGTRRMGLGFLAAALLMVLSRVYVGTHYASDVLGGALTGIVAAAAV